MAINTDIRYAELKGEVSNLDKIQVYFEDQDQNSEIFGVQGVPDKFSLGKHAFFINPTENFVEKGALGNIPNRLKLTTTIRAEIIDRVGNRVYYDYPWRPPANFVIIDGVRTALSREFVYGYRGPEPNEVGLALALEITDTLENGTGVIILAGELENVPAQWAGTYNARWKKEITIEKSAINSSRIYFYNQPTVSGSEVIRNYIVNTFSAPTTSSIVSGSSCTLLLENDGIGVAD